MGGKLGNKGTPRALTLQLLRTVSKANEASAREMGLAGGPHGAKALFVKDFAGAFQSLKKLADVRALVGVNRSQTLAVLDGNVMMNAMPNTADTFHTYVSIISAQIEEACQAAAHVVVVFDEPEAVTMAKRSEQRRRDEMRQARVPVCSADLVATITNDNYSTNDLLTNGCSVKLLMEFRKARPRFYDAVCVAVMNRFRAAMEGGAWSLTFDGIDMRGGDRGHGVPRDAGILSSDDAFWQPLLNREVPIGEGDLKLTDVTQRVHDAALREGTPVHGVVLNLVTTIDTDSFAIELLQQNRRERRVEQEDQNELTILCLKERARKRAGDDHVTDAHYLCCDMQVFHAKILEYVYGTRHLTQQVIDQQPAALALLAVGLACCGCDFVEVKGMRADVVLPVVRDIVRKQPEYLGKIAYLFAPERLTSFTVRKAMQAVACVLREYLEHIKDMPRMKLAKANASNVCDAQVLRALWTCAYWHQCEFRNCEEWGFVAPASNDK